MKNWINKIRKKITVKNSDSQAATCSNKLSESKSTLPIIKGKEDPKIKESGALKLDKKWADKVIYTLNNRINGKNKEELKSLYDSLFVDK